MQIIDTIELFPVINDKLISFLKSLSPGDWQRQTAAKKWVIKDVASHLLDGNLRRIAMHRDGWLNVVGNIDSHKDLVNYLNEINADWVKATRRLSPQLIVELLEQTNQQVYEIFKNLDPMEKSIFPVGWAGEDQSKNWFDIAREYTERWLHQQQIRDAVGDRNIMTNELYYPVLTIFMQAWPFACRDTEAVQGTILKTLITGDGGGEWFLTKQNNEWRISEPSSATSAETIIDGAIAWKLFSKSVRKEDVKEFISIKGERVLAEKILDMVSVMA